MKKKFFLTAFFIGLILYVDAQKPTISSSSGSIDFHGHVIKVYPSGNGYGYDIHFKNQLMIHQPDNPFTSQPGGLKNKEDAIKIAKWQVLHRNPYIKELPAATTRIPLEVSRQLNITVN